MPSLEWLELAIRWIHLIAGVAWIGTSFYFNWLNERMVRPVAPDPGVSGELWSVHGGGFYRVVKYEVAPERMPSELHWFKWEAYLTWISGAALLILIYYLGADVYLIDSGVARLAPLAAVGIGIGALGVGWLIYDRLCRSPLAARPVVLALVGFLLVVALAYGLGRMFGSRGAYMHVGAALGTIMAANVFRVIIPAQRELVDAVEEGREPDARLGRAAALRSLHNNYLTLPVLFVMISSHYPITYGHPLPWLVLAALFLIGAATRHAFNLRNQGRGAAWILPVVALMMIALAYAADATRSWPAASDDGNGLGPVAFQEARAILVARCSPCHSAQPSHALFDTPPKDLVFDTPQQIAAEVERIYEWAVASKVMPLGNFTEMTDRERALLGRWIRNGAPIE